MTGTPSSDRGFLHRFVPSQIHDPFGLARRLLATGDRAAYFAMGAAALGVAAAPLDLLLSIWERRRLARAPDPRWPIYLVCGPPRSGTTLVAQTLIGSLPVGYFANITSIFPRAPLTATRLSGIAGRRPASGYRSYYGRTRGWAGPNDALYFWDRWLGPARDRVPTGLSDSAGRAMRAFFGGFEATLGRPIVAKNNNLIGSAHLVADALPTARFIALERAPLFQAQALLRARRDIHGIEEVPYGLHDHGGPADPIESVCRQVAFLSGLVRAQRQRLGDRFQILSYEAFCADPGRIVSSVATELAGALGRPVPIPRIEPFRASASPSLPPAELDRIRRLLNLA